MDSRGYQTTTSVPRQSATGDPGGGFVAPGSTTFQVQVGNGQGHAQASGGGSSYVQMPGYTTMTAQEHRGVSHSDYGSPRSNKALYYP